MLRQAVVRSFLTGLGVALIATACMPENISAPEASAVTGAAMVAPSAAKGAPHGQLGQLAQLGLLDSLIRGALSGANVTPSDIVSAITDLFHQAIFRKHALKSNITVSQVVGVRGGSIHGWLSRGTGHRIRRGSRSISIRARGGTTGSPSAQSTCGSLFG